MTVLNDINKCTGCGLCAEICPKKCIDMAPLEGGFLYPYIDIEKCINCDLCRKKCPVNKEKVQTKPLSSYAFKDKNIDDRVKSASGGAASVFAKAVLENGGAYTGVRYNEHFDVVHDVCDNLQNIDLYRDSKYIQSNTNGIFEKIKSNLEKGKNVVATGTPCQIAAIHSYLGKTYDNLILCELICHGVPSPLIFKCYLKDVEKAQKKKIKEFYFRDKTNGWQKSNVKIIFDDKSEQIIERKDCDFYRLFGNNIFFRKCCHACNFKNFNTHADIIIGDYWGIEKKYPDFADKTGCSVVIVNTKKGQDFFDSVAHNADVLETDIDFAIETHPKLHKSIPESIYRKAFFNILKPNGCGYERALSLLNNNSIVAKLYRMLIKIQKMLFSK